MTKSATITGKVSQRVKERLKAIADEKNRDEADIVASFVEASLEAHDQKAQIVRARLAKADAGGPSVDGEDVKAWFLSWGTDDELPPPEATIYT